MRYGFAIDQRFVDVDVDDVGAVLDLLSGDGETAIPVAGFKHASETGRTGDVGAFTDDEKIGSSVGHRK